MFITPVSKPPRPFFWRKHRDAGIAAGMTLRQNTHRAQTRWGQKEAQGVAPAARCPREIPQNRPGYTA